MLPPILFILFFYYFYISADKFKRDKNIDLIFNFKRNFNKNYNDVIGDLNKIFYRIKLSFKKYEVGLSGLKEPGERFTFDIDTFRFLFNTNTIYILFKDIRIEELLLKNFILGNFKIGYGQGLVFNYYFDNMFKTLDPINIFRKQKGIKKCNSTKKNRLFGIGLEVKYKAIESCVFFSKDYFDAILNNNYVFTAKRRYRYCTISNLSRKNIINNTSYGFVILFNVKNSVNFGITFINSYFSEKFKLFNNSNIINSTLVDMDNLFTDNKNFNLGFFSKCLLNKFKIYSEFAISSNEFNKNLSNYGYAFILGTSIKINIFFKYVFLFRSYSEKYHNFYGKSFGSGKGFIFQGFKGAINNEIGLYNGLKMNFNKKITSKLSIDLVYIPARTFNFSKSISKYFIFDFIYNFRNFDYIKFQCKYFNSKNIIISKALDYSKDFYDNCRMKFSFRKKIKYFLNKTNLFISINPNEELKKMFGFGINEDFKTKINYNVSFSLYFTIIKTSKKTPIYIFKNVKNSKKVHNINKSTLTCGINTNIRIVKSLIIELLYNFKFIFETKKKENTLTVTLKYLY